MTHTPLPENQYLHERRKHALPSIETLKQLFAYDPTTGQVWHREQRAAGQERRRADVKGPHGYRIVKTPTPDDPSKKIPIRAHRLAFALVHDRWPHMIDHQDGNRSNNEWTNLSEVTARENQLRAPQARNAKNICRIHHPRNKQGFAWHVTVNSPSGPKPTSRRDFCKAWQLRQKMRAERDRARKPEPKQ